MVAADREGKSLRRDRRPLQPVLPRGLRAARALLRLLLAHDDAQPRARHAGPFRGRSTTNGAIIEQEMLVSFSPTTGHTLPDRYIEGTCPICGYPRGARRPVRQLRQPARPVRPDRPALDHRRLDAGVPRDDAPLPRPAGSSPTRLRDWIASHDDWRPNVRNFSLACSTRSGRAPITRDLDWGVRDPRARLRRGRAQAHLRLVRRRDRLPLGRRSSGRTTAASRRPGGSGGRTPTPSTTTSRARTTSSSTR